MNESSVGYRTVSRCDPTYIFPGFPVWRNIPAVLHDCAFAGVVTGECENYIAFESVQQPSHVLHTRIDVLSRVVDTCHAKTSRGGGHQLHQSTRALVRCRPKLEGRLLVHLGVDQ